MKNNSTIDKTSLILGEVYKSNHERLLSTINLYKTIYDLPEIIHKEEVKKEMFEYCRKRSGLFVIVAVYSPREGIFLLRYIMDHLGWELPGTSIRPSIDETLQDSVFRVVEKYVPGIEIGELEPVAVIKNQFKFDTGNVEHTGLGFMARSRNINNSILEDNMPDVQGQFVNDSGKDSEDIFRLANRQIFNIVMKKLLARPHEPPEEEISSAEKYAWRQRFHKATVSKIFKRFSSDQIKKKLLELIGSTKGITLLDVSCGDNEFVYDISEGDIELCVANDVSWPTIRFLMEQCKEKKYHNVIFTNHNVTTLPFAKIFDIVLCKNTLHHMRNPKEFRALVENLRKVCNDKIIIVEIEDPDQGGNIARCLHKYWYNNFLGDVGEFFFTSEKFKEILTSAFDEDEIKFSELNTIKGRYLFAVINLKN